MRIRISFAPSGLNHVYLSGIDRATRKPMCESRIVNKRALIVERERFASELFNRADVLSVRSDTLPAWAKNGGSK